MRPVLWVLGGFVVIVAVGLAVEDKPTKTENTAPASQMLTRDQFLDGCRVDRQVEACAQAVGQPDRRQSGSGGDEAWYFTARTFDPVTKKADSSAQVIISHGVVRRVNFY